MQCASSQGSRKGRVSRSLLPEVHSQSVTHQLSYLQLLHNAVLTGAAPASLCLPQGLEAIGAVVLAASEAAVMGKLLTWATNGEVLEALWTKCPTPEGGVLQRSR